MNLMKGVTEAFHSLSKEARELYLTSEVPVLSSPPSALQFYRNFVTPNIPVLIKNNVNHWPALNSWSSEYFKTKLGDKEVTVAGTPNGYADAVVDDKYFIMPEERTMKMNQFLDILDHKSEEKGIFYIQKQNSNFTEEFGEIIQDAALDIPWASEAFDKVPDAVNFWMGDGRAVTSMHKDHYENLYCVVSGCKTFTLIPPTDLPYVTYGLYKPAKYQVDEKGEFEIVKLQNGDSRDTCSDADNDISAKVVDSDGVIVKENTNYDADDNDKRQKAEESCRTISEEKTNSNGYNNYDDDDTDDEADDDTSDNGNQVPWISVDPLDPDLQLYPDYAKAQPITCTVEAGDTLYLPSLWFHHVQQSHKCIAVNFWYDMEYDIKYAYYKFLESLSKIVKE